jgi:hypothetical protein
MNRGKKDCEQFSSNLTIHLKNQIKHMKMMKQFLKTCPSESVIKDQDLNLVPGGLGLTFSFPGDPKKLKEKSKMKLWKEYFQSKFPEYVVYRVKLVLLFCIIRKR